MKKIVSITIFVLLFCLSASAQKHGYEKSIAAYANIGVGKYNNSAFGVTMVNGYRFNEYFFAGVGFGIAYSNELQSATTWTYWGVTSERRCDGYPIPIYLQAKAYLTTGNIRPFILMNVGYTFDIMEYVKDAPGLMFEPAFGLDIAIGEKQSIFAMAGFNLQHYEFGNVSYFKSIALKIGYRF